MKLYKDKIKKNDSLGKNRYKIEKYWIYSRLNKYL